MKIRLGFIALLLLMLTVLVMRNNERLLDTIYSFVNPIKQHYIALMERIESEGESYLMQKKTIDTLRQENLQLRKKLLNQMQYLEQLKTIYDILPQLQRYDPNNVFPVHAISYVKLNSFSRILLTKPDGINPHTVYGLIENDTVVGIARLNRRRLYGYLLSDPKCRFAVYVGENRAPGIAEGAGQNRMIVRYIPKWYRIQPGDAVVTSGLDRIFPSSLPVGTVTKVQTQSAYKIATVRTLADLDHPKILFLIRDTNQTLLRNSDYNTVSGNPESNTTIDQNASSTKTHTDLSPADDNLTHPHDANASINALDTLPTATSEAPQHSKEIKIDGVQQLRSDRSIIQTRDDLVHPEPPIEHKPIKRKRKPKVKKHPRRTHPAPTPLDLF